MENSQALLFVQTLSLSLSLGFGQRERSRVVVEMKFWSWLMLGPPPNWQETKLNSAKSISHQNLFHISAPPPIPLVGGNSWRCQFTSPVLTRTPFTLGQQPFWNTRHALNNKNVKKNKLNILTRVFHSSLTTFWKIAQLSNDYKIATFLIEV